MYQTAVTKKREKSRAPITNKTGLPDSLKTGIENLSGFSLDSVHVNYNSNKPAQLNAHAYAQGTEIHVAPGKESHLPHEAWHVVQQMQGRVKPTMQYNNVAINDSSYLEKEADTMGKAASHFTPRSSSSFTDSAKMNHRPAQRIVRKDVTAPPARESNALIQRDVIVIDGGKHGSSTSRYVIGLNLMPSYSLSGLVGLFSRRKAGGIGAAFSGHTSLISGDLAYRPPDGLLDAMVADMLGDDLYSSEDLKGVQGTGFSPRGVSGSLKIGLSGFLCSKLESFKKVPGIAHPDDRVTEDPMARQIVVRVTRGTYDLWNTMMTGLRGNGGIYTFSPNMGSTDNCGTWALQKAMEFCTVAGAMPDLAADSVSLASFYEYLIGMMTDISIRTDSMPPRKGVQGAMMKHVHEGTDFI